MPDDIAMRYGGRPDVVEGHELRGVALVVEHDGGRVRAARIESYGAVRGGVSAAQIGRCQDRLQIQRVGRGVEMLDRRTGLIDVLEYEHLVAEPLLDHLRRRR